MENINRRYWIKRTGDSWREVTRDEFREAEQSAGLNPPRGSNGLATGGFSGTKFNKGQEESSVRGIITKGMVTSDTYPTDPEFYAAFAAATPTA